MRFALLGPTYPYRGGIAQYTASLHNALQEQGHEVLVISFNRLYPSLMFPGSSQTDQSACPLHVPHEALLDSLWPVSWRRAGRRLARSRPEAVVVQWWHPFFGPTYRGVIYRYRQEGQAPVVFLCHNVLPHERPRLPAINGMLRLMVSRTFSLADAFLTHSQALVEEIREFRPGSLVRRIFHPMYDFYPRIAREREAGVPRLLFFGNVRPYKGLEVFLRALRLVREEMEFEAVVAGEFYMDPEPFKAMVEQLALGDRVKWRDWYIPNEEVPDLFEKADLVVLPYLEATQSGVVPLAYRFGVPVVASDVGGLSEVVLEGRTGYLVPPGEPGVLAQRILQYFREQKRTEFQANIEKFRERLNWGQVVEAIVEVVGTRGSRGLRG